MTLMFLSESLTVALPLSVVQHRLLTFLHVGDLNSVVLAAYGEGATVLTRAGVGGLGKTIAVESIPAYQRGAVTVVPIRWMATGLIGGAFPVLDANLEMAAADGHTELEIIGSYRPPLGKVGVTIDRLVLHAVARSTIRSFLGQLAQVAEQIVPAPGEGWRTAEFPAPEEP